MSRSVSYPIAKTFDGQWVHIDNAKHGYSYYCPECDSPFVARLGSIKTHHFAHKPNYIGICTGESGYHSLAKQLLAYHFEQEKKIPLISECNNCGRRYSGIKKVDHVEVEKGQGDYRPDARIFIEDDIIVDCEVIYRHPLGEKLNMYKEKNANVLIWIITGQVDQVPHFVQYKWSEATDYLLDKRRVGEERLILFGSTPPPNHECSPYGIAYILTMDCYKCHRKTKVALLSSWYPMWGNMRESGGWFGGGDDIPYHDYVSFNQVPSAFWRKLNSQYGTRIFEDRSNTMRTNYLMNHCTTCGAKIGDGFVTEEIIDQVVDGKFPGEKVEISFALTGWEKQKLTESQ